MAPSPNVLLITADHWPGRYLGVAGHPSIRTPTLDQLARGGARFPRAYTECPVCIPARRTLLTGTSPRTHGDRTFRVGFPLPDVATMADCFRQAGYQASAVGKLHVYPPRSRAGFDEVILCEEGRPQDGPTDDYEIFLGERGLVGQQFLHGMSNNDYVSRPWHLPEDCHVTNWITRQMSRTIQRRDPTRSAFWYLSYTHPHPPLAPLQVYVDAYRELAIEQPWYGDWPRDPEQMPSRMNRGLIDSRGYDEALIREARRAFYALCTHIDHQLRVVLGTLREEGLLERTIVMFLADHGDMLGTHDLWAKRLYYEDSACVPMILRGLPGDDSLSGIVDNRLVGLQDVLPTLLDMAGIDIPASVDGLSMVGTEKREHLYGEYAEGMEATRMVHDGRYKLVYYAAGNRRQLFDLEHDPHEMQDLVVDASHETKLEQLTQLLMSELYGNDLAWVQDGRLVGLPAFTEPLATDRTLALQRGSHWPVPPQSRG